MAPSLRPEDIQSKKFTVVKYTEAGYRQQEVDDFLDEINSAYSTMWADLGALELKAKSVATKVVDDVKEAVTEVIPKTVDLPSLPAPMTVAAVPTAPAANGPSLSTISLLLTQAEATAAKLVEDAKAEAERVKGMAYSDAAQMKSDAASAADKIKADGASLVAKLKADAEADIAAARVEANSFVAKLKADAGSEASALLDAAKAEKAQLVEHVTQLTNSKSALLGMLKEVVSKVEGK